jgi:predicted secreted hydrolase
VQRLATSTFAPRVMATLIALLLVGCSSAMPIPAPTPTPPYGLPPITLPADDSPHHFQTEWWYFNAHFSDEQGALYALHDVVFQVQQAGSGRTLYVRQIGFVDDDKSTHLASERLRTANAPTNAPSGDFEVIIGDGLMSGIGGRQYRLMGSVQGTAYDLILTLADEDPASSALLHDNDGLVDFGEAGVTYYYSQPRLDLSGTLTTAEGTHTVTGLAWMDKQWGDFQPVAVFWDWASIQLDDGTDLMLTRLTNANHEPLDTYATLRLPGGNPRRLSESEFVFEPLGDEWVSTATGITYPTRWRVELLGENRELTLEPLVVNSEFASALLGVVYWEAAVHVVDDQGVRTGQGFIELNWGRTFLPN